VRITIGRIGKQSRGRPVASAMATMKAIDTSLTDVEIAVPEPGPATCWSA
jgi:hypothetical protein